jgi:hypothetical protein
MTQEQKIIRAKIGLLKLAKIIQCAPTARFTSGCQRLPSEGWMRSAVGWERRTSP